MKRIHILLMALVALSIQGCQDDFNVPSEQASRSYEQDAEVLNRFVDINKTTHEYYINPNKRTTALSYITNDGAEELAVVNSLNLDVFQQSVDRVSKLVRTICVQSRSGLCGDDDRQRSLCEPYQKRFPHSAGKDE